MYYGRLRDLREDSDLKQADVAAVLNIMRQQYQLYESGKEKCRCRYSLGLQNTTMYRLTILQG